MRPMYRPDAARLCAVFVDELDGGGNPTLDMAMDETARRAAIARAIAATPPRGRELRTWAFADAVLVGDLWMCLLEEKYAVYLVDVHARTGEPRIVAQATVSHCVIDRIGRLRQRNAAPRGASYHGRRPATPMPPRRPRGSRCPTKGPR